MSMFCHRCGQQLPSDALFCNHCGTKLQNSQSGISNASPSGRVTIQFDDTDTTTQYARPTRDLREFEASQPTHNTGQFGNSPNTSPNQSREDAQFPPPYVSYTTPIPPSQSNISGTQYPPVWQVATEPPTQQVRTSTPVPPPMTSNRVQEVLLRIFGANLSTRPLFGIALGGVLAAVSGLLVTALLLSIVHALAPQIATSASGANGEDIVDYALGLYPLHNLYRDSLQFFLLMHGIGTHTQNTSNAGSYFYTSDAYFPLYGLLIVPALLLIFSGYVAASTDFQHSIKQSLWRGVGIAIPYTILLLLMASQANGCIPNNGGNYSVLVCQSGTPSPDNILSMDTPTLLLFGILWGGLFGLIGASLKIARGQWRHMMFYLLRSTSYPQLTGAIVGAFVAGAIGVGLSMLCFFSFMAYSSFSVPLLERGVCLPGGGWQSPVLWNIAQGPLHAINVLFFSFGAPLNINNPQQSPCFYTTTMHTSLSLFGTTPPLSPWTHLLLAIPLISLFFGGKVSAAIGRAKDIGTAAMQGAFMALPLSVLMVLLSLLCTITYGNASSSSSTGPSPTSYIQTIGAGGFDLFLWVLLGGAVVGTLGGMYQVSSLKVAGSALRDALSIPLLRICKPFFLMLDKVSHRSLSTQLSSGRALLYGAFLSVLLLTIVSGIVGANLLSLNQVLTFEQNIRIRDILSVIIIALPGLLLLGAIGAAITTDPENKHYSSVQAGSTQLSYMP